MLVQHHSTPGGLPGDVSPSFAVDLGGPALYGGMVIQTGGWNAVVRWDGLAWTQLGPNVQSPPTRGLVYDSGTGPYLYANARAFDGLQTYALVRWNGQTWENFGGQSTVFTPDVRDLCIYDDGTGASLYVASTFSNRNNLFDQCIARWNGTQWSSVGGGMTLPADGRQVDRLAVFDDGSGSGPELYALGQFTNAGGLPARGIAKWNGQRWAALGQGIGQYIEAAAAYTDTRGPSLFIGGSFQTVGGGVSPSITRWVGCPNCYANCDLSTTPPLLNVADFTCFLRAFAARDPYANCTVDQAIDVGDFACFLAKFVAGCP